LNRKVFKEHSLTIYMKAIYEKFTDEEIKIITKEKNGLSWHDWIIMMAQHCNEAVKKGDLKIFRITKKEVKK